MMDWSWPALVQMLPDLLRGASWTVCYTAAAFPLALLLGICVAGAEAMGPTWSRRSAAGCASFVRGTPLLVQIYALYFLLPELGISLPAYVVGAGALALHYACYISQVYLAGLRAVPAGQWEASQALGLRSWAAFYKVVAPQALLPIYPALANYLVTMFKETPLLSAIGIVELMQAAKIAGSETFRYAEPFTAATVLFLIMTLVTVAALRLVEARLRVHLEA
jgi:polar amino acid transport system permease protein